jgi:hypothetical protein
MVWHRSVAGNELLPGEGARLGHLTCDNRLADGVVS